MAQSKSTKKLFNMAYGIGAAVVILGALFKIMHFKIGFLTGGAMLSLGMGVEAFIFFLSAFEPIEEELDWSKVYPELSENKQGRGKGRRDKVTTPNDADTMLSQKLDNILKEANLDVNLMSQLGDSIRGFQGAVKPLSDVSKSVLSTNVYNEQISKATTQLASLSELYKTQVERANKQMALNTAVVESTEKLKEQMQSLAKNLSSLNGVYGGMLSAMSRN